MTFLPVPGLVSNLTLYTDKDDLTATWSHRMAENYYFTVRLQRQGQTVEVRQKVLNSSVLFSKLRRGVNYTVSVSIVTGGVRGPSVEDSTYTSESSNHSMVNKDDFNSPASTAICSSSSVS